VVLPLVLGIGWLLGRLLPGSWRLPARVALVVGATIALATFPVVMRYGLRPDNPSVLPLAAGRNLLVLLGLLATAAVAAGGVTAIRNARRRDQGATA